MPARRFLFAIASIAAIVALMFPASAHAVALQRFSFRQGDINAKWEGYGGISSQQLPDGTLIATTGTGTLATATELVPFPGVGTLYTTAAVPVTLTLQWDVGEGASYYMPIAVAQGENVKTSFDLSTNPYWRSHGGHGVRLGFPPASHVVLHGVEFASFGAHERLQEVWKSFWTFDGYRPYSINFVWGPRVTTNPVARDMLYASLPPRAASPMYVFNGILLLLGGTAIAYSAVRKRGAALRYWIVTLVAVWIMFDLRMGLEFLSWVKQDQASYISRPSGLKTLRERERFYDFAEFAAPLVKDRQSYLFFAHEQWPYLGNIRYITYPAIPGNDLEHDDTWVIYHRPDIGLSAAGQLLADGQPVSEPGKILGQFDDESFVFRVFSPAFPPQ